MSDTHDAVAVIGLFEAPRADDGDRQLVDAVRSADLGAELDEAELATLLAADGEPPVAGVRAAIARLQTEPRSIVAGHQGDVAVAMVLKPLLAALADGDPLHCSLWPATGAPEDRPTAQLRPVHGIVDLVEQIRDTHRSAPDGFEATWVADPGDGADAVLVVTGPEREPDEFDPLPLVVSAPDETGVAARASALAADLRAHPARRAMDVAFSLADADDAPGSYRAAGVVSGRVDLLHTLDALADSGVAPAVSRGPARLGQDVVFVFPGLGPQWPGMARELAATFPVFHEHLERCDEAFRPHVDFSILDTLFHARPLDRLDVAQTALFSVVVSLDRLWRAHGIVPAAMLGHSIGEISAVTAAGGLSLEDGARVMARVALAQVALDPPGDMVAVGLPAAELQEVLAPWAGRLEVGVVNGPRSTVASGDPDAADELIAALSERGVRTRRVHPGVPAHSWRIEEAREFIVDGLDGVQPRPSETPVYSTTTGGRVLDTATLRPEHWFEMLRNQHRFDQATELALGAGHRIFLEVSPHPTLTLGIEESAAGADVDVAVVETLRRDAGGPEKFLQSVTALHVHGPDPEWSPVFGPLGALHVDLPEPADEPTARTGPEPHEPALPGVLAEVAGVTSTPPAQVGADQDFRSLGLDSARALELRNRLNQRYGLRLPVTVAFDHPSPTALAGRIDQERDGGPEAPVRAVAATGSDEPIAIVGIGCRLPGGVRSPEDLWDLVVGEVDAVTSLPDDRGWDLDRLHDPDPDRSGTFSPRAMGFLDDAAGFDAEFFGLSPREALAMDPQQRQVLEVVWEALERVGEDPTSLRGTDTSVFTGAFQLPYGPLLHEAPGQVEGHLFTGTTSSVASGRIAYTLGLQGPAVSVDTACSASLVAVHLACQSLRTGESSTAVAAGVTVLAQPGMLVEFSRQRALSPDGRSKAFSAGADGFGMAEGVGAVVLERLSDAVARGHRVWGVIRGSAINQDGASNGLTAPNGPAQERVIRQALANAGVPADEVDVVEAHGTGTPLGDPLEAQAILATYGRARTEQDPVRLGSLKSNIGHTQAAAGIAGLIKMVMALQHATLPRTLHAGEPTPHVDWSSGGVRLLDAACPWPARSRPMRAAVSSFGISGTNAHLVLEQAPDAERQADPPAVDGPVMWELSARSEPALAEQAARLITHLDAHPTLRAAEIGHALTTSRTSFVEHRAVLFGDDLDELRAATQALAVGTPHPRCLTGTADRGPTAFVFSGQGCQYPGMARELHDTYPVFREAVDEVSAVVDERLPGSLRMFLLDPDAADPGALAQPALFAHQVALYRLLESWGSVPDLLAGHSLGEYAAAHVAGLWDLTDACTLVTARARLMHALSPADGAMTAVDAGEDEVAPLLDAFDGRVSIAAVNSPVHLTLSGDADAVDAVAGQLEAKGHKAQRLRVTRAFHSVHMDPVLDEFAAIADTVTFHPTRIPMPHQDRLATPEYWTRHLRDTVRYVDTVAWLTGRSATHLLEIGPDSHLTTFNKAALEQEAIAPLCTASQRRTQPQPATLHTALATQRAHGAAVGWAQPPAPSGYVATLPTYAFQHSRYWLGDTTTAQVGGGMLAVDHPILGAAVELPGGGAVHTGTLSRRTLDILTPVPGSVWLELVVQAADRVGCPHVGSCEEQVPLVLPAQGGVDLRVTISAPGDHGRHEVTVHSRAEDDEGPWCRHAVAEVSPHSPAVATVDGSWPPAAAQPLESEDGSRALWRTDDQVYAEVALPEPGTDATRYALHPALLAAALRPAVLDAALPASDGTRAAFAWDGVTLHSAHASRLRVTLTPGAAGEVAVRATDPAGDLVLTVDAVRTRVLDPARLAADDVARDLRKIAWRPVDATGGAGPEAPIWLHLNGPADGSTPDVALVDATDEPIGPQLTAHRATAGLLTVGSGERPEDAATVTADVLRDVQRWLADPATTEVPLVVLTHDAVAAGAEEDVTNLAGAAVWGMLRSAQTENPDQLVLVDHDGRPASLREVAAAVRVGGPQIALREGVVRQPRIVPLDLPGDPAPGLDPNGTVLVTGATGNLAGHLATALARDHGVRHLLLVSRSAADHPALERLTRALADLGAEATVGTCDITDAADLVRVLDDVPAEHPLTAVLHTAGAIDDTVTTNLTPDGLRTTLAPKADPAWTLHEYTRDRDLTHFLLFSSVSATIGGAGQANYNAANAYLDALAQHRRARGLPATSLAWGLWAADQGMTTTLSETDQRRFAQIGLRVITPEHGARLLGRALGSPRAHTLLVPLDTAVLRTHAQEGTLAPLWRELVTAPVRRPVSSNDGSAAAEPAWADILRGLRPSSRPRKLLELVRGEVAAVLGHVGTAAVAPTRSLKDLGFDSLTAVELRNRLNSATGLGLPSTAVYSHPSAAALAEHLGDQLLQDAPAEDTTDDEIDTGGTDVTDNDDDIDDMDVADLIRLVDAGES